jgi:hypothetical protein
MNAVISSAPGDLTDVETSAVLIEALFVEPGADIIIASDCPKLLMW